MAGRGGYRPGAGRKTDAARALAREACLAGLTDEQREDLDHWQRLVESDNERVLLSALIYLTNRAYGRPRRSARAEINASVHVSDSLFVSCASPKSKESKRAEGGARKPIGTF